MLDLFVGCGISFEVANNPIWKRLLLLLRGSYQCPCARTLKDTLLPARVGDAHAAAVKFVSTDGWTTV